MTPFADPCVALTWTTRLLAVAILLDSTQMMANRQAYRDEGVLGWPWLRKRRALLRHRCFGWLFAYPNNLLLFGLQLAGALVLLVWPLRPGVSGVALAVVFGATLLINLRQFPYGLSGAQRMAVVIAGALLLYHLAPGAAVAHAVLWFIAAQSCLSYATAGWAKWCNPLWRSGWGLQATIQAPMIAAPASVRHLFQQHKGLAVATNWLTLGMESTFPLVLIAGVPFHLFYLAWGFLFHAANALLLGLNLFFWVWMATYPAILYAARSGIFDYLPVR